MTELEHYNSNILLSDEGIIYVDNIKPIKSITRSFLKPNQLIVTSYNYNFYKNYDHYKGTSYELYYIDNDSTFRQLTYYVNEGNGLYIDKDYNLGINIDNKTIKENDNHELYIDSNELTCAYNNVIKGILGGDSRPFYDHHLNESGFIVSDNGILKLSNGLLMSLYEIQNYYNQFDKLALLINKMAVKLDYTVDVFEVGDILYIDKNGKYTKVSEGNMPYMICVISSNILSDGAARFLPLKFNNTQSVFAKTNNYLYYKKMFSHVPVYDDDLNSLSRDSNITLNDYGYISTDNKEWSNNFKNPFNFKEHYYANINTMESDIIWYLDPDIFHKEDKYSLDAKSIVTEIIKSNQLDILDIKDENDDICPIIEIEFSDGFKAYYMLILTYSKDNERYEVTESSKPIENGLLLTNKINDALSKLTKDNNISTDPKIKLYNVNTAIISKEFITQFNLMQNNKTIRKIKFENDNANNIDYKILVEELKNKKEDESIIIKDTGEEINEDDLYIESINEDNSQKNTLAAVHNNANKIKSYNEEVIKHTLETTIYTYKLIVDPGLCDREYAYFIVQLGDNNQNISEEIYLKYDNNEGLEYVFTQYQSTSNIGYIKITAYGSSEYFDKEPINLGIIPVNAYQDSFKVVYLSKDNFSFKFNLSTIIPIKAKLYKNYTILDLNDNAIILENNNYDDYIDSYEYSLDLNYYTIYSEPNDQSETNDDNIKETITYSEINNNNEIGENKEIEVYNEEIVEDELSYDQSEEIQEVVEELNTKTGTTIMIKKKIYPLWWLKQNKYRLIPGAIRIMLKDNIKHQYDFMNNVYYAQINIRNSVGAPTYDRFKFIKKKNYLELAENIPVYDVQNINQITIKSIQDSKGNNLNIKLRPIGNLINRVYDWIDLRTNN